MRDIPDLDICTYTNWLKKEEVLKNIRKTVIALLLAAVMPLAMTGCVTPGNASENAKAPAEKVESNTVVASENVEKPAAAKTKLYTLKYSGKPYTKVNRGIPSFSKSQLRIKSYEKYGKLDRLGRCTSCTANIGRNLMPTEKRGSIGMIKPTGWHTIRYSFVDGKYLYNRCHLIGYQLTGENANKRNLITGTRYMNVDGMEPFETEVAQYIRRTGHHVLYRVTPIFKGRELVARGVHMEAESVEDHGRGIRFNIYCYNVQPGVKINYVTGDSRATNGESGTHGGSTPSYGNSGTSGGSSGSGSQSNVRQTYIVNVNTKVFHRPGCSAAKKTLTKNKRSMRVKRSFLIRHGYRPCKFCRP